MKYGAGYVRNIADDPHVRLKLRDALRSRWHVGSAHLLKDDDDPQERQHWLTNHLSSNAANAAWARFSGTQLFTVRTDFVERARGIQESLHAEVA